MSEFVNVPVPVERVKEVYRLLGRSSARPTVDPQDTTDGYPAGWSQGLIDRMFLESSSAMRRILSAIANKSPDWVTTDEIAEAAGLTARQVVASLGPFEKRVRGRYDMDAWPFASRVFVDAGLRKYSMSPGTAGRVIALQERIDHQESGTA